jgi:peptidoglycan/xylan/chitin deacetylase (PgdA/CDA1 family)
MSHRMLIGRPGSVYDQEIAAAHTKFVAAGAPSPTLFRPPYGKKLWGLPMALRRHGYRMVMIDFEEPETSDPQLYAQALINEAQPGSICLCTSCTAAIGRQEKPFPS